MKIKGIKRGQIIELLEPVENFPDGVEIVVDLEPPTENNNTKTKKILTQEERLARLNQLFGVWKDQPELIEIFAEIDKERHASRGRSMDSIDTQDHS
ncbi:hypothetical protein WA1_08640 [Scytonema hofmannii PCC 7110]|uniref:Uncharacterized protein n=1 Tax=Scytonema hofmannii PCC 7110 TaxID=128403 RepID=A0A139WS01_9CYAN|nr:hypothetical protein [Scytonema hofmannii]KYC35215.1 hypothetical protein WA1_08640 [Scytonema hofmannii PCC 7110]